MESWLYKNMSIEGSRVPYTREEMDAMLALARKPAKFPPYRRREIADHYKKQYRHMVLTGDIYFENVT